MGGDRTGDRGRKGAPWRCNASVPLAHPIRRWSYRGRGAAFMAHSSRPAHHAACDQPWSRAVITTPSKGWGIIAAAAALALFTCAATAQDKKAAAKPAACNALKAETDCQARTDCQWVAASVDPKTKKEKRKAYCRSQPKSKKTK